MMFISMFIKVVEEGHCFTMSYFSTYFHRPLLILSYILYLKSIRFLLPSLLSTFILLILLSWPFSLLEVSLVVLWTYSLILNGSSLSLSKTTSVLVLSSLPLVLELPSKTLRSFFSSLSLLLDISIMTENTLVPFITPSLGKESTR